MIVDHALTLGRMRLQLLTRWSVSRYTPYAQDSAPLRLSVLVSAGLLGVFLAAAGIAAILTFALRGQNGQNLLEPAVTFGLSAATVAIFFYGMLTLVATFTYKSDLGMLLLTPLPPRLVLAEKLISVSLGSSVLLFVMGMPLMLGVGKTLGAGLTYDLATLLVVLVLPIPPIALAMLLVLASLRWLPPARARSITATVGLAIAAVFYIGTQTLGDRAIRAPASLGHASQRLSILPTMWPGNFLAALMDGHPEMAALYLGGIAALSLALGTAAVLLAAHLFASGWTTYQEVGLIRRSGVAVKRWQPRPLDAQAGRRTGLRPPWWPILRKEWLTARRDPKLLAQLAYPLIIEAFSFYRAFGLNPSASPVLKGKLLVLLVGSLYLTTALTAVFLLSLLALPIVNREGRSLYLLALAPLRARDVLLAKWAFCAAPVLVLVEGLLFVAVPILHLSAMTTFVEALILGSLVIALAGSLVCVGLMWPRISSDNTRRQVHPLALVVGPLFGVMLVTGVGWLMIPTFAFWSIAPAVSAIAILASLTMTGLVSAGSLLLGPRLLGAVLTSDRKPS